MRQRIYDRVKWWRNDAMRQSGEPDTLDYIMFSVGCLILLALCLAISPIWLPFRAFEWWVKRGVKV